MIDSMLFILGVIAGAVMSYAIFDMYIWYWFNRRFPK